MKKLPLGTQYILPYEHGLAYYRLEGLDLLKYDGYSFNKEASEIAADEMSEYDFVAVHPKYSEGY